MRYAALSRMKSLKSRPRIWLLAIGFVAFVGLSSPAIAHTISPHATYHSSESSYQCWIGYYHENSNGGSNNYAHSNDNGPCSSVGAKIYTIAFWHNVSGCGSTCHLVRSRGMYYDSSSVGASYNCASASYICTTLKSKHYKRYGNFTWNTTLF